MQFGGLIAGENVLKARRGADCNIYGGFGERFEGKLELISIPDTSRDRWLRDQLIMVFYLWSRSIQSRFQNDSIIFMNRVHLLHIAMQGFNGMLSYCEMKVEVKT